MALSKKISRLTMVDDVEYRWTVSRQECDSVTVLLTFVAHEWMIEDFNHLKDTDAVVDEPLRDFNRMRREDIVLPQGWNGANKPVQI